MNHQSTNMHFEKVHITRINVGDTVFHNERLMTVCRSDIKMDRFTGRSIFGDSYHLGYKPVIKVNYLAAGTFKCKACQP